MLIFEILYIARLSKKPDWFMFHVYAYEECSDWNELFLYNALCLWLWTLPLFGSLFNFYLELRWPDVLTTPPTLSPIELRFLDELTISFILSPKKPAWLMFCIYMHNLSPYHPSYRHFMVSWYASGAWFICIYKIPRVIIYSNIAEILYDKCSHGI